MLVCVSVCVCVSMRVFGCKCDKKSFVLTQMEVMITDKRERK